MRYTTGVANWLAMVQYPDGENDGAAGGAKETDYKRYLASAGVHYTLSKRTMLYAVASWADGTGLIDNLASETATGRFLTHVGIGHSF